MSVPPDDSTAFQIETSIISPLSGTTTLLITPLTSSETKRMVSPQGTTADSDSKILLTTVPTPSDKIVTTTDSGETDRDTSNLNPVVIGGATGAGLFLVVVFIIMVGVALFLRRRSQKSGRFSPITGDSAPDWRTMAIGK